jgi:hypothetical protein
MEQRCDRWNRRTRSRADERGAAESRGSRNAADEINNEGAEGLGPLLWLEINLRESRCPTCACARRSRHWTTGASST